MEELKSIDYAKLIQCAAFLFCRVLLNKVQIQKILFYVYGVYLATEGEELFEDDAPQAWPFGPVFPIVNKSIDIHEVVTGFSNEKNEMYKKNGRALQLIKTATCEMCHKTASELTAWSHKYGSPWYKTIFAKEEQQAPWGTPINQDVISTYFKDKENCIYGE